MHKTLLSLLLIGISAFVFAGNFSPGNIVIIRVGSGTATLSNASTAVYLDEYTITGTLVQSIAIPAAVSGSNHALTLSGSAATEGELALSPNQQYLTFTGFDTVPGYASVSSGVTNRTIARVDAAGTVNTSTGFIAGSAFVAGNFRSAVTNDGSEFWAAGSGGSTGGIWYTPFGSFTASGVQTSATQSSVRDVNIFGGQLYFTISGGGVYTDGTGLPTTIGQTETLLPGMPTVDSTVSPFAFLFLDENGFNSPNVLYVADNTATGGIYKYSLVSGNWVSNGNIGNSNALTGLTGFHSCHGTTLFASCPTGVYSLADTTGYNQTITGSYTQIVTGAPNTLIHGIAFTPGTPIVTSPIVSIAAKYNVKCFGGSNGSIITSLTGGYGTVTYNWGGGITTPGRSNLSQGSYTVTVTDALGCTSTASTSVSQPTKLTLLSDSITNLPCTGGSTGAINIVVSGGSNPYHYSWTPGSYTTQNISGLVTGEYKVTVTDDSLCTLIDSFHISQSGSLVFADSVVGPSCYNQANGSIVTYVSGGTPGYNYTWSGSFGTADSITQIPAGGYTVTVTDQAGCTLIENINVSAPDSLSIVLTATDPTTHGGTNGSIVAEVTGGTPYYTYMWTGSSSITNLDTLSDLAAGSYCVTATDTNGCTVSSCDSLSQPLGINELAGIENFSAYVSIGTINIDLTVKESMNMSVEIYDLTGQMIYHSPSFYQSHISLQIQDTDMASGCYIIKASTDQGFVCNKVVVVK
jgi:hypothetical protein